MLGAARFASASTLTISKRLMSVSASNAKPTAAEASTSTSPLVMQLIVNQDLLKDPNWSLGPLMAQAAHAATAILAQSYSTSSTQKYIDPSNLTTMRKIVLQTSEPLIELSKRLEAASKANNVDFPSHHLWIEEPEDIATVLAIAPNTRPSALKKILSKCSLLRG